RGDTGRHAGDAVGPPQLAFRARDLRSTAEPPDQRGDQPVDPAQYVDDDGVTDRGSHVGLRAPFAVLSRVTRAIKITTQRAVLDRRWVSRRCGHSRRARARPGPRRPAPAAPSPAPADCSGAGRGTASPRRTPTAA